MPGQAPPLEGQAPPPEGLAHPQAHLAQHPSRRLCKLQQSCSQWGSPSKGFRLRLGLFGPSLAGQEGHLPCPGLALLQLALEGLPPLLVSGFPLGVRTSSSMAVYCPMSACWLSNIELTACTPICGATKRGPAVKLCACPSSVPESRHAYQSPNALSSAHIIEVSAKQLRSSAHPSCIDCGLSSKILPSTACTNNLQ